MLTQIANRDSRLSSRPYGPFPPHSPFSFWPCVREFAVPASMIETATARRRLGDWAGACAAARVDVDFSPRVVARTHGRAVAARLRADLRHLAPDLLRWHMPRIAPDGLLRPGLTIALARYDTPDRVGVRPLHLVARTPPAWADAGQRISLAVWDGTRADAGAARHPHPHPHRRFRLDLHRHLWDARRTEELRTRSGADRPETPERGPTQGLPCAVGRWAAEAELLLRADGRPPGPVVVRLGAGRRLILELDADGGEPSRAPRITVTPAEGDVSALPVLPDAATWVPPDLALIRSGAFGADRLHPLVASALVPEFTPVASPSAATDTATGAATKRTGRARLVECRGAKHRIALVDGALAPLDHDPAEIRREELLAALTGTPLPCLRVIDEAHRRPDCLSGVRERLDHGDITGALAVVEELLGPDALLREGPLRDALTEAADRRVTYGLYRAGLIDPARAPDRPNLRDRRTRPRRSTTH
ncbi:hypothetical protein ACFVYR_08325 [Streptomyces sp. NPDC058284]|uniref:hypothetical protein n=1 Tax=unclassified Streptomyces TaxID=2593676 RepID=UPI003654D08D